MGPQPAGKPNTIGARAEPPATTAAPETTTTTEPGPPTYTVSLDVHVLDDSYRPIAVSPKTWGAEVDYHVEATLSEGEAVELDPPARIHWWVKCHNPDNWEPLPDLSWDVEEQASWLTDGPIVSLQVHDEELWLVHRLPSQAQLPKTRESCEESIASHFPLGWGGSLMQINARKLYLEWTTGAEPGHLYYDAASGDLSYGVPEGRPVYIETGDEYSGFVVWTVPIADLGIETHEVDYSFGVAWELHVWDLQVTGTIAPASS